MTVPRGLAAAIDDARRRPYHHAPRAEPITPARMPKVRLLNASSLMGGSGRKQGAIGTAPQVRAPAKRLECSPQPIGYAGASAVVETAQLL